MVAFQKDRLAFLRGCGIESVKKGVGFKDFLSGGGSGLIPIFIEETSHGLKVYHIPDEYEFVWLLALDDLDGGRDGLFVMLRTLEIGNRYDL